MCIDDLLKSAEHGNSNAQFKLGEEYWSGLNVIQDDEKAHYWFLKSAEQGHVEAQYYMGLMCQHCFNLKTETLQWYHKAAEQGHVDAMCALGIMYYYGWNGMDKDHETAMSWFKKSADKGDVDALEFL